MGVSEIQDKRAQRFYDRRMRLTGKKKLLKKTALREIKQGIDLVVAPHAHIRQKVLVNLSDTVLAALKVERPSVEDTPMSEGQPKSEKKGILKNTQNKKKGILKHTQDKVK